MTSILVQKHPIKGSREFRLTDDEIQYTIKSPFKTDSLSVLFDVLNAEPVISGSTLSFISNVNKEPLVEMFLDKPDKKTFDQFVKSLQQKIIENDFGRFRVGDKGIDVDIARLDESIEMLQKNVDPTEIELLLSALIELKTKPDDIKCQNNVAEAFNELGFAQSQVIIHAPYINFMFSGYKYSV
jgi:archaellum component FlaC